MDGLTAQKSTPRMLKVSGKKSAYKSELTYPPFGNLGEFPNVRWKADKDGGRECYFVPDESLKIWELVYLKRAGVRQLKQWAKLEAHQRRGAVLAWIESAYSEKLGGVHPE